MLAGIIGDVLGSVYEAQQWKIKNLPLIQELPLDINNVTPLFKDIQWVRKDYSWTDDTLCTLSLYHAYINNESPTKSLLHFCNKYKSNEIGFGHAFKQWLNNPVPYGSFGNGALMRIGFIPYLNISLVEQMKLAYEYTAISHNHPDSFDAVTQFVMLSERLKEEKQKDDFSKKSIQKILKAFNYNETVESLHVKFKFELNALTTFLQACVVVLESTSMQDILINSFYVGGDSDTLACIACNLGSMLYENPENLLEFSLNTLKDSPDLYSLVEHFIDNRLN